MLSVQKFILFYQDFIPISFRINFDDNKLTNDEKLFQKVSTKGKWIYKPSN